MCVSALAGLLYLSGSGRDATSQEWNQPAVSRPDPTRAASANANSLLPNWPHSPQSRGPSAQSQGSHTPLQTHPGYQGQPTSPRPVQPATAWDAAASNTNQPASHRVASNYGSGQPASQSGASPQRQNGTPLPPLHSANRHPSSAAQPAQVDRGADLAAYAVTAITPKGRVTANEWAGPKSRPLQPIQQTSYAHPPTEFDFENTTGDQLLSPFEDRASGYPTNIQLPVVAGQLRALPKNYSPWWNAVVNRPMRADLPSLAVDVESLILNAIQHSPQVTAMRIDPVLRETVIVEEEAEFDWTTFVEATYDDNNDPVGNTLTLGPSGDTRYEDRNVYGSAGLRKRMGQGGELDVTSRAGYQRTNSSFFVPGQQGTTRLEVNFTQPLLKGAGQIYNESRIVLASIDRNVSEDELVGKMQDHLVAVYKTYWTLYRARAVKLQKQRLLQRAIEIEQHLEARQGIDAIRRQVLRANAAVASRRSEIVRADMAIRNAESQLRLLVNSPELKQQAQVEMLPTELPLTEHLDISLRASIEMALQHRPEIAQAIRKMKATSVRLGIARNEMLPKLDLVLGAYVAALKGNGDVTRSFGGQFADGRPGYTVGVMFEFPLGNRAARARNERRQWEVAKAFREFEAAVETGMTDVELAVRELETSYQEMLSRFQAMIAAETEANYLMERWRLLPGSDQTISFLLEDLLDAQERVADEEAAFVNAQSAYVLSIVELKRATGVLLNCDCDTGSIVAPGGEARYVPPPSTPGPAIFNGFNPPQPITARPSALPRKPLPPAPLRREPLQPLPDASPLPRIN